MVKRNLEPHKKDEEKSSWVHFVAGLWAEVCGATVWVPQVRKIDSIVN